MKAFITALLVVIATSSALFAQLEYTSQDFRISKVGEVKAADVKVDFAPVLTHIERGFPGGEQARRKLEIEKNRIASPKAHVRSKALAVNTAEQPILGKNFEGNLFVSGVPNDNDLAISNGGMLVSVVNSNIYMFDVNRDSLLLQISLSAFSDTLGLPHGDFDPHVVYDPNEDKFILVFLNGRVDSTNEIVVAFSESNDPTANWHFYAVEGNPLNNRAWSDYPLVGLSHEEFFFSVNLIYNDSSWQEGFVETLIWQMDKFDGFSGNEMDLRMYSNIEYEGKPIRNMCPVIGGSGPDGPGMRFLSNRNFSLQNDTIFLAHITGTQSDPSTELKIEVLRSDVSYGLPPDGEQGFNHFLATNDARILSAFIEDDVIQFVGNSVDFSSGRAAVYHGLVQNVEDAPQIEAFMIADSSVDLGYPVISYSGRFSGDRQSIISYNYTAVDSSPGISATFYHQFQGHSKRRVVKLGDSYVNVLSGTLERWGDYSGSQLKYDEPGVVWIAGFYGHRRLQSPPPTRVNATWIAELQSPFSPVASINERPQVTKSFSYPNPTSDRFSFEFETPDYGMARILLIDSKGQTILLYSGLIKKGKNLFSFDLSDLAVGTYSLHVLSGDQQLARAKVMVLK